jgi:hypothetical protein
MRKYIYINLLNYTKKSGFYKPPFPVHKQGVFVHKQKCSFSQTLFQLLDAVFRYVQIA